MSNPRSARVAERIHEIVASLVINRLKDPRLELVTITDVRVTGDLQHATVFYTVYGGQKKLEAAGKALASARGLIRSQVGGQLGLRLTPTIEFIADALPETARSLEDALVAARHRDEQIARAAKGAVPAGEADPYRRPRQEGVGTGLEAEDVGESAVESEAPVSDGGELVPGGGELVPGGGEPASAGGAEPAAAGGALASDGGLSGGLADGSGDVGEATVDGRESTADGEER